MNLLEQIVCEGVLGNCFLGCAYNFQLYRMLPGDMQAVAGLNSLILFLLERAPEKCSF